MTPAAPEAPFRKFALEFYGHQGVEAAALRLQDEAGGDVLLTLYGLWRTARGEALAAAEARKAADLAEEWAARVVRPLRMIRRAMRSPFAQAPATEAEAARQEVKAAELAMEMRLIAWLEALPAPARRAAPAEALARENLRLLGGESENMREMIALWREWAGV